MGFKDADNTKGGRKTIDELHEILDCPPITASIRYGHLRLVGDAVNVTFQKNVGQIKITGFYGL